MLLYDNGGIEPLAEKAREWEAVCTGAYQYLDKDSWRLLRTEPFPKCSNAQWFSILDT